MTEEIRKIKWIDKLSISIETVIDPFTMQRMGCTRLRFRITGDGNQVGYDQLVPSGDLTKSVFDHMWDSAKLAIEDAMQNGPKKLAEDKKHHN